MGQARAPAAHITTSRPDILVRRYIWTDRNVCPTFCRVRRPDITILLLLRAERVLRPRRNVKLTTQQVGNSPINLGINRAPSGNKHQNRPNYAET